jgi:hypothetical protein
MKGLPITPPLPAAGLPPPAYQQPQQPQQVQMQPMQQQQQQPAYQQAPAQPQYAAPPPAPVKTDVFSQFAAQIAAMGYMPADIHRRYDTNADGQLSKEEVRERIGSLYPT